MVRKHIYHPFEELSRWLKNGWIFDNTGRIEFHLGKSKGFAYICPAQEENNMKQLRLTAIFALLVALFTESCSNEFDLTAPYKEIPVVYAILSPTDTAHYVRVEKAFLDPKTNALVVAQIADSLYYPENAISVYLQKVGSSTLYQLKRVDGNQEGFVRDSGVFAQAPNWLYKIKDDDLPGGLSETASYRLIIKRQDGRPDITAETIIPKSFNLIAPNTTGTPPFINFLGKLTTTFRWTHDENAVYFNIYMVVPYRVLNSNGTLDFVDTLYWTPVSNKRFDGVGGNNSQERVVGNDFYSALRNHMLSKDPNALDNDGRIRYFGQISIAVEGGGREIYEYNLTEQANAGLTGAEILQTYTNMSEGFGIFTAKNYRQYNGFKMGAVTIDSMRNSTIVQNFNFKF